MVRLHLILSLCFLVPVTALTFLGSKSFASFNKWDASKDGILLLRFKTYQRDGSLLYLEDNNGNYIHLKLFNGRIVFSNSVGETISEGEFGNNLNDAEWHRLEVITSNGGRVVRMFLDKNAVRKTVSLQGKLSECSVFVGGIPADFSPSLQSVALDASSFLGCIDVEYFTKTGSPLTGEVVKSEATKKGCQIESINVEIRKISDDPSATNDLWDEDTNDEFANDESFTTTEILTDTDESFTTTEALTDTDESFTTTETLTDTDESFTTTETPTRPSRRPTRPSRRPTRPSRRPTRPSPGPSQQCGRKGKHPSHISKRQRIVGGKYAARGEYPWQVALLSKEFNEQFCGGSLIDKQWVLTAAHCVTEDSWQESKVRVGEHNLKRCSKNKQDINIASNGVKIHRFYNRGYSGYDIALLKLAQPVTINKFVNTICLNDQQNRFLDDTKCLITGWGKIHENKRPSPILKEAIVPLVSQSACKEAYDESSITHRTLCAGFRSGGTDTCGGDSGGPLMCEDNGSWYLTGITSSGEGCARKGKYGVYMNVAYFIKWIKHNMK